MILVSGYIDYEIEIVNFKDICKIYLNLKI